MEEERLVFLSTSSHGDGVRHQIEKVLEQRSKSFNAILRQVPSIGDAIKLLTDGVGAVSYTHLTLPTIVSV